MLSAVLTFAISLFCFIRAHVWIKKNPSVAGSCQFFFFRQHISQMGHKDLPREALGQKWVQWHLELCHTRILRKPIATCDFTGGGPDPLSPPMDMSMRASCNEVK